MKSRSRVTRSTTHLDPLEALLAAAPTLRRLEAEMTLQASRGLTLAERLEARADALRAEAAQLCDLGPVWLEERLPELEERRLLAYLSETHGGQFALVRERRTGGAGYAFLPWRVDYWDFIPEFADPIGRGQNPLSAALVGGLRLSAERLDAKARELRIAARRARMA